MKAKEADEKDDGKVSNILPLYGRDVLLVIILQAFDSVVRQGCIYIRIIVLPEPGRQGFRRDQ